MQFEKEFVYCVWDDVLINKEVVAAGCMSSLIANVEHDDDYLMPDTSVCVGCNENVDYPFKIRTEDDFTESYSFVYYDPNYVNKLAFENGKQIQYFDGEEWLDVNEPEWLDGTKYRVKPDEPKSEPEYRPYKDIDAFIYEYRTKHDSFGEPLVIWLKSVVNQDVMYMCDGFDRTDGAVRIANEWCTLDELFKTYTYLDGTPLGVKE